MTQEEKQLLLQDLCARLPYGVKLQQVGQPDTAFELYSIDTDSLNLMFWKYKGKSLEIGDCGKLIRCGKLKYKPYLRPMSSMTEEEMKEYHKTFRAEPYGSGIGYIYVESIHSFDWLNKHGFDYRDLIGKGLAIAVTEENNPYKD